MVGCEDGTILVSVCAARARTRGHSCMRATGVHRHVCLAPHPRRGVVNARFLEIHVCTHSFRDSVCRCKCLCAHVRVSVCVCDATSVAILLGGRRPRVLRPLHTRAHTDVLTSTTPHAHRSRWSPETSMYRSHEGCFTRTRMSLTHRQGYQHRVDRRPRSRPSKYHGRWVPSHSHLRARRRRASGRRG